MNSREVTALLARDGLLLEEEEEEEDEDDELLGKKPIALSTVRPEAEEHTAAAAMIVEKNFICKLILIKQLKSTLLNCRFARRALIESLREWAQHLNSRL